HGEVGELYQTRKLWEEQSAESSAAELSQALAATLERQRAAAIEKLAKRGALGAPLRWLLTIGAALWFPIVQPIAEALLQAGPMHSLREIALLVVKVLSGTYLLQSAAFLVIWFVFLWLYL